MTSLVNAMLPRHTEAPAATIQGKRDESRKMKSVQWFGTKDVRVMDAPVPLVTDAQDVVLRVTSTAICGSDLHLYTNAMPGMKRGDLLGHEFMGIVEEVGPGVRSLKKGDRVVTAFDIGCGHCWYCKQSKSLASSSPASQGPLSIGSGCGPSAGAVSPSATPPKLFGVMWRRR